MEGVLALGTVYELRGAFELAEKTYSFAMTMRQDILGPLHPFKTLDLSSLSLLYFRVGAYGEAEALLRQGLPALTAAHGGDSLAVANALSLLALAYAHTNGACADALSGQGARAHPQLSGINDDANDDAREEARRGGGADARAGGGGGWREAGSGEACASRALRVRRAVLRTQRKAPGEGLAPQARDAGGAWVLRHALLTGFFMRGIRQHENALLLLADGYIALSHPAPPWGGAPASHAARKNVFDHLMASALAVGKLPGDPSLPRLVRR
ncbi:hypothetical protein T484DRAFT_1845883 [Baffinella frigidus]|nr:hypothetical protein T484DRAFT_1845883 [Cryptophyta sp. CCMP2293]